MVTTISTRIDDKYVKKIDELATRKGVDRSALLRSFLLFALAPYDSHIHHDGKTTLWEAAEQCNLSLWEMVQEVKQRQIHTPYDIEELEKDLKDL